jgi:SAGA-associated factor 73
VSRSTFYSLSGLTQLRTTEAAIDANAPLEDEDDANAGPVDSDEETAAVMNSLSRWNPRPVVEQPVLMPIKRQYQLARLREQLDNATSGGTVNIFKVVSKNGEPLKEANMNALGLNLDVEDAPGEPDYGIMGMGGPRRGSSIAFGLQQPPAQRRAPAVSTRQ